MKLHQVPNNTKITIDIGDGRPDEFLFKKMDGMYGICIHDKWGEQYIRANTNVEILPPTESETP